MKERIQIQKKVENMTVAVAYEKFIVSRQAINISDRTIEYYNYVIKCFNGFYGEDNLCTVLLLFLQDITDQEV